MQKNTKDNIEDVENILNASLSNVSTCLSEKNKNLDEEISSANINNIVSL